MRNFYKVFPEYLRSDVRSLYFTYSKAHVFKDISSRRELRRTIYTVFWYAAQPFFFCPHLTQPVALADAILNSNLGVPLKGAAIGNGWIDVRSQYPSYLDFMVKVGILEENSDVSASYGT